MSKGMWALCVLIEAMGIIIVSVGIGIELAMGAHVGFALITAGSLLVAAGGVIYAKVLRRA